MLACVERPGAPLEPHENGPDGPPFLVSAPPSPALPLSRLALEGKSPPRPHARLRDAVPPSGRTFDINNIACALEGGG